MHKNGEEKMKTISVAVSISLSVMMVGTTLIAAPKYHPQRHQLSL